MRETPSQKKRKSFLDVKSMRKYPAVEQLKRELEERQWLPKEKHEKSLSFKEHVVNALSVLEVSATRKNYKMFFNALFYPFVSKYERLFSRMRRNIELSDMVVVPDTYIALAIGISLLSAILTTIITTSILGFLGIGFAGVLLSFLVLPPLVFLGTFVLFYLYPEQTVVQKKQSIDINLPFAITHMSAVASSGIPPENIFRLLVKFSEYGGVSKEAKNIVRRIDNFGDDLTTAIHRVAKTTPSKDFKELLYGIVSIIESGGNLREYLKEAAQISMFNYELTRKKYTETLTTFADIYTALLIAAPLFLVSVLVVINIVPESQIGGLPISLLLQISAYVIIPALNIIFLLVLNFMQPEV